MKKLLLTFALVLLSFVPVLSFAGQDESQRMMTQQLQAQRAKLIAADKLQGAERDKSMQEYMLAMQKTMSAMQLLKPRPGSSSQEQLDWIEEQQKLIQQIMEQLMTEHDMLMRAR